MSDTNPQGTPAQVADNSQGISIDNLLNNLGNTMPEGMTPPDAGAGTAPTPTPSTSTTPVNPVVTTPETTTSPAGSEQATPPVPESEVDEFDRILLSADGLSAEDAQLRTNILTKFGASNVDAQGNLLDSNNRVILKKENLDRFILNDELLLDAQGNHVNEFGEIISPAEQVASVNTLVNSAKTKVEEEFGFKFLDAEGKPKTYANTPEGNAELLTDAINNAHVNAVKDFLESNEEVKRIFFHLSTGGTLDNYVNDTFDYTKVNVAELTREQKLNYIKSSFEKQGLQNASSTLKLIEGASDEQLNTSTSEALLALNKITEQARQKAEQDYIAKAQEEERRTNAYWTDIKSRIDGGKLKDITIPANEKQKFFEYIATAVDNQGRSQELIDMANEDPEFGLMVSYLRYKKLDLNALIGIRSRGNKLHNARERFNIAQPAPVASAPPTGTKPSGIISLESLQ